MESGRGICDIGRAVTEDGKSQKRLRGQVGLVEAEADYTCKANEERDQSPPRRPRIHDATPGKRYEEAGHAADEDDRSNPVDSAQFCGDTLGNDVQSQEQGNHDNADADKR